ncbi:MAG: P-II family nitrogen regulator [Bacteroidia bacterium]
MEKMHKIEIVLGSLHTEGLIEILNKIGISGYTIIPHVKGKGDRGEYDGLGLNDAFSNNYIIVVVDSEMLQKIKDPIRNYLSKYGGACIISDCLWLKH